MSLNLVDAFKAILKFKEVSATLERRGEIAAINLAIAPSNYFRDFSAIEEITTLGNEYVIDRDHIVGTAFETDGILRGDILTSTIYGTVTIDEVRPMVIMGSLVGYRVRSTR